MYDFIWRYVYGKPGTFQVSVEESSTLQGKGVYETVAL